VTAPRVIAVDWSGALTGAARKIWLAEVRDGAPTRLECGRDRAQIQQHLLDLAAAAGPDIIVGLDFAFSTPAWFLRERGFASAFDLWAHTSAGGAEAWLAACEPPFWGRPGVPCPPDDPLRPRWRRDEREVGAKSVFQVGGAGAVGTGSLRGMPLLHHLRAAGFAIWPFERARLPLAVEIYPRILTGPVSKSSADARAAYCAAWHARHGMIPHRMLADACASDDAFDALFSALAMARNIDHLRALPPPADPLARLEGAIWRPPDLQSL